jgi:hypothetical protein
MTMDTVRKHVQVRGGSWAIGGVVKGVGHDPPHMATMLCFMTTDAAVDQAFLAAALKKAVDVSFNMIDVDSDTSPDDIALVLANGLTGGAPIDAGHPEAGSFEAALETVCVTLARKMVADAEGSTKVIEALLKERPRLKMPAWRHARSFARSASRRPFTDMTPTGDACFPRSATAGHLWRRRRSAFTFRGRTARRSASSAGLPWSTTSPRPSPAWRRPRYTSVWRWASAPVSALPGGRT